MSVPKPLPLVSVHFLGTCSGGGPIVSRNCSSLALDFGNDVWLFDAADGTLPRLHQSSLKLSNISRIFITHLHADHVLGLVTILTTIMSGIGTTPDSLEKLKAQGREKKARVNIYGPRGLRRLIRTSLEITSVTLGGAYAVHELLQDGDASASVPCEVDDLHTNEAVGVDMRPDESGVWQNVMLEGQGKNGKGWGVSAGPIEHRVPALGYILQEPIPRLPLDTATLIPLLQSNATALAALDPPVSHPLSLLSHLTSLPPPFPYTLPSGETLHPPAPSGVSPRKIVIFGDCSGGTKNPVFQEMCADPSLLIHECTNAAIPELIQRGEKGRKVRMVGMDSGLVQRSEDQTGKQVGKDDHSHKEAKEKQDRQSRDQEKRVEVRKKAQGRGHSTPDEVGEFAGKINARRLVVNHFSAMFPSPRYPTSDPLPSLLAPISPYPFPTPYPPSRTPGPVPDPLPLTSSELHLRVIMQSLADQVTAVWARETQSLPTSNGTENGTVSQHAKAIRRTIAARDFMIVRLPAHELTEIEQEDQAVRAKEAGEVLQNWQDHGGAWLDKDGTKEWIGVDGPPGEP